MDTMDDYRAYVQKVAAAADGVEVIQNKTEAHASVIIAALFDAAMDCVEIVSGRLDSDAYGADEVVLAAMHYLRRRPQGLLKIVVENKISLDRNKFLKCL